MVWPNNVKQKTKAGFTPATNTVYQHTAGTTEREFGVPAAYNATEREKDPRRQRIGQAAVTCYEADHKHDSLRLTMLSMKLAAPT